MPKFAEVQNAYASLERAKSEDIAKKNFAILASGVHMYGPSVPAGAEFVRSVHWGEERKDDTSWLSYPPARWATAGRCNREGSSVFYCADDLGTIFSEQKAGIKVGAHLGLGLWRTSVPIIIVPLGFNIEEAKQAKLIPSDAKYSPAHRRLHKRINKYFYEKTDLYYPQTQGISARIKELAYPDHLKHSKHTIICYRSVAYPSAEKIQVNYVFPTEFIDEAMTLVACEYHRVDEVTDRGIKTSVLKQSRTFEGNKIIWSDSGTDIHLDAQQPFLQFTVPAEGQPWDIRDQSGNAVLVPPRKLELNYE
ncbi:hypothetical protein PsAD5_01296 [Pseudovibrio sp. Ad5]|uniref:RES family NAD+ phosphorylase n=1 Tax=Pseudovibrio sp. Ad5 TaxID=989436 RepID=UPI0007AEAEE7|nr:RES family NAD+ phosphorylase [Pseudovibrio sp. Ad5]KZK99656.1 hypothetical protein PsAD5_01296 [Pseudovibrio sp. Ad5]